MVKEELYGIDIDGIRNLADLPRHCSMFNNGKCGNLKVVEESFLEIITERRVRKFYKPIDVNSVTNSLDKIEVSMIFLAVTVFWGRL